MIKVKKYVVIIPAYNEGKSIKECIQCVFAASKLVSSHFALVKIIVCINGCTDNTEDILCSLRERLANEIEVIHSEKSYNCAINQLMNHVSLFYKESIVIKVDADSFVIPDSFQILLSALSNSESLVVAGGHPLPKFFQKGIRRFISSVFYIRSIFPNSEVSKNKVDEFHHDAVLFPQKNYPLEWELKSKIYFHGRFWALKNTSFWFLPKKQIGDDVFFSAYLHTKYPGQVIRTFYNANCYFSPYATFTHHWKVYKRIESDKQLLANTEYDWYIKKSVTHLDWKYIFSLDFYSITRFLAYSLIRKVEDFTFKFVKFSDQFWEYSDKTRL